MRKRGSWISNIWQLLDVPQPRLNIVVVAGRPQNHDVLGNREHHSQAQAHTQLKDARLEPAHACPAMRVRLANNSWQARHRGIHLFLVQYLKFFERTKERPFRVDRHDLAGVDSHGLSFPASIFRRDALCFANSFLAIRSISGSLIPYSVKA